MGNHKNKKEMEQIYYGIKDAEMYLKEIGNEELRFTPNDNEALLVSSRVTLETLIQLQTIVEDTSEWVITEFVGTRPIGR